MNFINEINDILWTYILIIMLLGCAVWFSIRTRFVQFRMLREMIVLLSESAGKGKQGEKHVSSFQAFAITIASRVGTGNLAGVATAIAIGGPGAVFWMWVIALLGASSAFIESTLAQLYKIRGKDSFVGGPAYYMKKGLKQPWMGMLFAVLISITFGFATEQYDLCCCRTCVRIQSYGVGRSAYRSDSCHHLRWYPPDSACKQHYRPDYGIRICRTGTGHRIT